MNRVLSLPRELIQKGDLVIIPRGEYEELLRRPIVPTFKPTVVQKKDLIAGRREYAREKSITLAQFKRELGTANKKKR